MNLEVKSTRQMSFILRLESARNAPSILAVENLDAFQVGTHILYARLVPKSARRKSEDTSKRKSAPVEKSLPLQF